MTVRRAARRDAAALALLRWEFRSSIAEPSEAEAEFLERCEPWMEARLPERADGSDDDCPWHCWVAESEGTLAGCLWLQAIEKVPNPAPEPEQHAYLTNIFVRPDLRGSGLGSSLLSAALDWCRARGIDAAFLWATPESRSLYGRHGFAAPARIMERAIAQETAQ